MKRLKSKHRIDNLQSEVRGARGSISRWVYLLLVTILFVWLADAFLGGYFYFKADGMVMRDNYDVAVTYRGNVENIRVSIGDQIDASQPLVELKSLSILQQQATTAAKIAEIRIQIAQLRARSTQLKGLLPAAKKRRNDMLNLRRNEEKAVADGLQGNQRLSVLLADEYESIQHLTSIREESKTIEMELLSLAPTVSTLTEIETAINESYAGGIVSAQSAGIISDILVSPGSVIAGGDSLVRILVSSPYVLAYVTPGALISITEGDSVTIRYGLKNFGGTVSKIFPISARLPNEFQRTFRPRDRAQVIRIEIDEKIDEIPATFTKVKAVALNFPDWFE